MAILGGQQLCFSQTWEQCFSCDNLSKRKIETELGIEPLNLVNFSKK